MNAISKFNAIILNEAKKYQNIEEMETEEFIERFCDENVSELKIILYNDDEEVQFYNSDDAIEFLVNNELDEYSITISYLATRYLDIIVNIVFQALKNRENFTKEEQIQIVDYIAREYIGSFIDYKNIEVQNIINKINDLSPSQICDLFFLDDNVSDALLTSYCDDVIVCQDYVSETIEAELNVEVYKENIFIFEDINTFLRNKLITIIDDKFAEAYDEKDICMFLDTYLIKNYSMEIFNENLFNNLYKDKYQESYFKNYMIALIIYDFYLIANEDMGNDEALYLEYIRRNTLIDSIILFKNDIEFGKCLIKYFILNNFYMTQEEKTLNNQISEKFKPISTIDKLIKKRK